MSLGLPETNPTLGPPPADANPGANSGTNAGYRRWSQPDILASDFVLASSVVGAVGAGYWAFHNADHFYNALTLGNAGQLSLGAKAGISGAAALGGYMLSHTVAQGVVYAVRNPLQATKTSASLLALGIGTTFMVAGKTLAWGLRPAVIFAVAAVAVAAVITLKTTGNSDIINDLQNAAHRLDADIGATPTLPGFAAPAPEAPPATAAYHVGDIVVASGPDAQAYLRIADGARVPVPLPRADKMEVTGTSFEFVRVYDAPTGTRYFVPPYNIRLIGHDDPSRPAVPAPNASAAAPTRN